MTPRIHIVYYAYLYKDWRGIVLEQLDALKGLDLYDTCEGIRLTACGSPEEEVRFRELATQYPKAVVDRVSSKNLFEYPGIKCLHEWAQTDADAVYLYFHTKGMTSGGKSNEGRRKLFKYTIANWKDYMGFLEKDPGINLMGVCPQGIWVWFNFFWARGSLLKTCKAPEITPFRHLYEGWVGEKATIPIKSCDYRGDTKPLSPAEACQRLSQLA